MRSPIIKNNFFDIAILYSSYHPDKWVNIKILVAVSLKNLVNGGRIKGNESTLS